MSDVKTNLEQAIEFIGHCNSEYVKDVSCQEDEAGDCVYLEAGRRKVRGRNGED